MALRHDVAPLDVPDRRHGVAAPSDPIERLVLTVELPPALATAEQVLTGTLAFLSRIGGRQRAADVGLQVDGGPDRALRLPTARGPFVDYEVLVQQAIATAVEAPDLPSVVAVADVAERLPPAVAGTGPALVAQISRCGPGCRWIVDTAVWPRTSAEILRDSCRTFLAGLTDSGDLSAIPLVDEAEQRRL